MESDVVSPSQETVVLHPFASEIVKSLFEKLTFFKTSEQSDKVSLLKA